jgi:hypothetical protein
MGLTGLALMLTLMAAFFYVLYLVVRAAVRDGIRQAQEPVGTD